MSATTAKPFAVGGIVNETRSAPVHKGESDAVARACRLRLNCDSALRAWPSRANGDGEATAATRRRALVVDDQRDVADSFSQLLELMGCQVRAAYDGFDALDAAMAFKPHIVFLDVSLPKLDGYEVARRLRSRPETTTTPLVAVTGWREAHYRERARKAAFDRYLVKPADPAIIEKLLGELPLAVARGG